jgi:alkaline phosphatase D
VSEISRRGFLGLAAGTGAALAGARLLRSPLLTPPARALQLPAEPFTLGIASGDPLPDRVVLWTRLAPDPQAPDGGMAPETFAVRWEVAHDERFAKIAAKGKAIADPEHAHALHVDAKGLEPGREYFYRFIAANEESPVGHTRTAPAASSSPKRLRLAFGSCQDYEDGYYAAHRHLADEDVDAVLWLGDYIYEGSPGAGVRVHEGPEVMDVAAYRRRYGTYKSDPDLQAAHAAHPWVVTWDDHETDNNYAGDLADRDVLPPDQFLQRRAAAYQVWWEHQPVRLPPPDGPDYRIYRRAAFGDLLNAHVLDTRQYRTNQPCNASSDIGNCPEADSPDATLLGAEQREWLFRGLDESRARWDVLAQQVMFAPTSFSPDLSNPIYNLDQWDGYRAERNGVRKALAVMPRNGIVLTGDIHSSWVNDILGEVADSTGTAERPVATELVGTSITSNFPLAEVLEIAASAQPHVKYVDGRDHGYVVLDVTRDRMRADFRYVSAIEDPNASISTGASFVVEDRQPGAKEA